MAACAHWLAQSYAMLAIRCGKQTIPPLPYRSRPIDLLLVDYAMPEMNGSAVIDCARASQPGLKTLLITGHAEALRNIGVLGIPVLAKPFKVAELSRRIAEILNELSAGEVPRAAILYTE